jgi:hypothetical protein
VQAGLSAAMSSMLQSRLPQSGVSGLSSVVQGSAAESALESTAGGHAAALVSAVTIATPEELAAAPRVRAALARALRCARSASLARRFIMYCSARK